VFRLREASFRMLERVTKLEYLSSEDLTPAADYRVERFAAPERVQIEPPVTIEHDGQYDGLVGTWTLDFRWFLEAYDARLLGKQPTAFTRNNAVIGESITSANYRIQRAGVSTKALRQSLRPETTLQWLEPACSLVGLWSNEYFHWLVEHLPSLEALNRYEAMRGQRLKILIDSRPPSWKIESLSLMGYSHEDIITWDGHGARLPLLLVPGIPRHLCSPGRRFSMISPAALAWLRGRMVDKVAPHVSPDKRIFVSRGRAPGRRILNESDVKASLLDRGFVSISPEELTFVQQVRLFSQAEVVIGPHGAALANAIFARRLKLIELFGDYHNFSFFTLAASRGFTYGSLRCRPVRTAHPKRHDMTVNLSDLHRLLDRLGV
jgi:capsular polysaccharide biosynthesis protein